MSSSSSRLVVGMSRVWLSLGLVFALTATLLMGSPAPAGAVAGYGDVPEGTWYTDAVQWSVDNAITDIAGVCFAPETPASRGETAVWIYNMENQPDAGEPHSFTDVTDASQDDAISWMANNEITTGTSPTTFAPDETLRRAQAAAFLHRLAGEPPAPPHGFVDVVAGWQQDAVSWMAHSGITTGTTPTTFAPEDTLTRAQLITFLYRYKDEPDVTVNTSTPHCDPTTDTPENPTDTSTEPTEESIASSIADAEAHMVSLVNELRKSLDVAPLEQHDGIAAVARRWSNTMHENDDFMHNPGWRTEYPPGWVTGGENIGKVSYHGDLISEVERAFNGLSDSPGHYQNMIRPAYGQIGVGIAIGSGSVWVTQNFACYPTDPETRTCGDGSEDRQGETGPVAVRPPDPVDAAELDLPCMDDSKPGTYIAVETNKFQVGNTYAVRTDGSLVCLTDGVYAYNGRSLPRGHFSDITSGAYHTCALRTDASLSCWTADTTRPVSAARAQTGRLHQAPTGKFTTVSAGQHHTCALRTGGEAVCWGWDYQGETEVPQGSFKSVVAGGQFSCALRTDSSVVCWGAIDFEPPGNYTYIDAGPDEACGVRADNVAVCWNSFGILGGESTVEYRKAYASPNTSRPCGIRLDDTIHCTEPVEGDPTGEVFVPHGSRAGAVPDGRFEELAVGDLHSCGLRTDQTIVCWGNRNAGLVNRDGSDFSTISALGLVQLSRGANRYYGCGIRTDKSAVCWNKTGGNSFERSHFTILTGQHVELSIKSGPGGVLRVCSLNPDGAVFCGLDWPGSADAIELTPLLIAGSWRVLDVRRSDFW